MRNDVDRDSIVNLFLPYQYNTQHVFARLDPDHELLDDLTKQLLGTEDVEREVSSHAKHCPEDRLGLQKQKAFYFLYLHYSYIFDLCRVLGVKNLYDIGCQTVNQSFLLANPYTQMSYTGITNGSFDVLDFLPSDVEENRYDILTTKQTPLPLCNGRIRFIKGHYPNFPLEVLPNNIAIASHSFPMCPTEERVAQTVAALVRDFERILFDIPVFNPQRTAWWKQQDWQDFKFYAVGPSGFFLATKHAEDIRRMEVMYPHENGRFLTGIGALPQGVLRGTAPRDVWEEYVDWD